jgi:hypothetical protein
LTENPDKKKDAGRMPCGKRKKNGKGELFQSWMDDTVEQSSRAARKPKEYEKPTLKNVN